MSGCATGTLRCPTYPRSFGALVFSVLFALAALASAQTGGPILYASLPDAPQPDPQIAQQTAPVPPQSPPKVPTEAPCQIKRDATAILQAGVAGAIAPNPANPPLSPDLEPASCPPLAPFINWYARFLNGPQVKPLTPKEKGLLAIRDLIDPFNFLSIAANSAIAVGSNSHSPYGPGMAGWARNAGVSFTEDMTAEFVGTFAIASIAREDPHYHRMPNATIKRRIAHAIYQIAWTQGDNGKGMINYDDLVGFAIDGAVANLYVPGQQTDVPATVSRYATALGTAPIDNFITEFLPSIASRIHTRVFFVQGIINQVARSETSGQ